MTVAWLRVVLKNISSPPIHQSINPILLFMSGNIEWSLVKDSQPHICQIVCSFSFIFLWRAIHNLHLWHRIHHVSHHILPPRDSNCWICDIIKQPVVSSLFTSLCHPALSLFPFDPLTSICSVLPIAPHEPICPQVQGVCHQRYLEVLFLFPYPLLPPLYIPPPLLMLHMLIQLQQYRMGELWTVLGVYEELVKQKVFSSPAFPFLLLLFTSSYILYEIPFSFYFYAL